MLADLHRFLPIVHLFTSDSYERIRLSGIVLLEALIASEADIMGSASSLFSVESTLQTLKPSLVSRPNLALLKVVVPSLTLTQLVDLLPTITDLTVHHLHNDHLSSAITQISELLVIRSRSLNVLDEIWIPSLDSCAQQLISHKNDITRKRTAESFLPAIARHDPTCIGRLFSKRISQDQGVSDMLIRATLTLAKAASNVSPAMAIPEPAQQIIEVRVLLYNCCDLMVMVLYAGGIASSRHCCSF